MADYKPVVISKGSGGFGGPLTIVPDDHKNKVVCITGGVMSPVAQRIAEMTGCELIDGFKTRVPDDQIAVVVIDCGGTLRCGIYPQKRIATVNLNATGPSGPLAEHIKSDVYVSGVKPDNVSFADGAAAPAPAAASAPAAAPAPAAPAPVAADAMTVTAPMPGKILSVKVNVGDSVNSGDLVLMLEAMKMENEVFATASGKVTEIRVKSGDNVSTGDILMVIA